MGHQRGLRIFLTMVCICTLFFQMADAAFSDTGKDLNADTLQTIPSDRFREAFDRFLVRETGRAPSDIVVSRFKVLRNEPVPEGKVDIRIVSENAKTLAEYVRLKAAVTVNGNLVHTVELRAWLDIFATVLCASQDLKRNRIIGRNDLYFDRRNVSDIIDDVVEDMNVVTGLTVKHNIRADAPIKTWMLKKTPVVQRGDLVTILVQSGGLRVTAPGKVLDDGFSGQTVGVLNTMSNKKVFARVVDDLTVQVDI